MVATHSVCDHSPRSRDRLSPSDRFSLCKIAWWLWHTRTGGAAFPESVAVASRVDTLSGLRFISRRMADPGGSAPWNFPFSSCSVFAADVSVGSHWSSDILGYSFGCEA